MNLDIQIPIALGHLAMGADGFPKVFPDIAPMDTPYPYITFSYVGGVPISTFCGDAPVNSRIQFNVWAQTRLQANAIAEAISALVTEPPFRAVSQARPVAEYNAVTKARGSRLDFSFWYRKD